MRLAVYTDYAYVRDGSSVYAERAFSLFLARLSDRLGGMTLVGRLRPAGEGREDAHYELPPSVAFVPLPHYERLVSAGALIAMLRSVRAFWRTLSEVDACWLLGPHPLCLAFALMAIVRRRQVVLGVRQDTPAYVRGRHPRARWVWLAADLLDGAYRLLARRCRTVVVGPALARRYAHARDLLEISVSLVVANDIAGADALESRGYDGNLTVLSVGRIDEEKNPLLLADVLARLTAGDPRWRLVVCGEGPMLDPLRNRLAELGVDQRAELRGYVKQGEPLRTAYAGAHALLHTSWTEGLPQVLIEAMAAAVPTVATDVGGISEAVGAAAILVPPGDADAAAAALQRVASEPELRRRLVADGRAYALAHTLDHEVERVADFIAPR